MVNKSGVLLFERCRYVALRHARRWTRTGRLALGGSLCVLASWAGAQDGEPVWIVDGRLNEAARQAVTFLLGAAADGLEPDDYGAGGLEQALGAAGPWTLPGGAPSRRHSTGPWCVIWLTCTAVARICGRSSPVSVSSWTGQFHMRPRYSIIHSPARDEQIT